MLVLWRWHEDLLFPPFYIFFAFAFSSSSNGDVFVRPPSGSSAQQNRRHSSSPLLLVLAYETLRFSNVVSIGIARTSIRKVLLTFDRPA